MHDNLSPKISAPILIIYFIVFCSFFDTHAQMPILAPFAISLGATPFTLGLVVGFYSLLNIFGNFSSGVLIDNTNWQKPLLIGLIGVSIVLILYTAAGTTLQLILIRAAHGYMGGILVPAALASLTTGDQELKTRNSRLALFGALIGMAAIAGPIFSGIIAGVFSYSAVYLSLAVLMATAAILSLIMIKITTGVGGSNRASLFFREIYKIPQLKSSFLFALGTMGSTGTLAAFLPVRAETLGFDHIKTGILFATFAFSAIIVQIFWPKILKLRLGSDFKGCRMGLLLLAAALLIAARACSPLILFSSLFIFGVGFGLAFQGMLGLVINNSLPEWRGRAIGIFFATYSLGVAIIPPLSGLIWQQYPLIFPFYTAATAALISMSVGCRTCDKKPA